MEKIIFAFLLKINLANLTRAVSHINRDTTSTRTALKAQSVIIVTTESHFDIIFTYLRDFP